MQNQIFKSNPFEKPINTVKTLAEKKAESMLCSLIGRGNKYSFVVLDRQNLNVPAWKTPDGSCFIEHVDEFKTNMLNAMTYVIKLAIKNNVGLDMVSVDPNAVYWRTYRKHAKTVPDLNSDKIVDKMIASTYFKDTNKDTPEVLERKVRTFEAIRSFVETMVEADKKGLFIEVQKVSEFNQIILNVPQDVKLKAGDTLTFKNGVAEHGITVNSWKNFNRENARVMVRMTKYGKPIYSLIAKAELSPEEKALRNTFTQQWNMCPPANANVKVNLDAAPVVKMAI